MCSLVSIKISPTNLASSTLVPETFFYSFVAKFATRTTSFIFYFLLARKRWEPSKESLSSRPLGSSLWCHQLLTVVSDWRIFLIALRVIWLNGLNIFGDVIGQKKITSLTAVMCWASMKVKFSTILTRGFLFSQLGASLSASISAWRRKFPQK